jgi:hypothetical protein
MSKQPKAQTQPVSSGRKSRPPRRRGSVSSRPKETPATSAPARPKSSAKRKSAKPTQTKSSPQPAQEQPRQVSLPGRLYQRNGRWWWDVALPGEDESIPKPLIPQDAKEATDDLDIARKAAIEMWEQALARMVEGRVKAEASQAVARLKAQFLEKVRDYAQIVETTKVRLEAETQARAKAEAKLRDLASCAVETTVCDCCGATGIPTTKAQRIDSGQLLCPDCLAALRTEVDRINSQTLVESCV